MRRGRIGCTMLVAAVCAMSPAAAAELVANASYGTAEISRPLLRGVFGMRVRAWPDGTPVRVFVLRDDHAVHQDFCKSILKMYPYQLRQNWDRLLYSGTGQPPILVSTEEEMLRRVAETRGGIGYLGQYRAPAGVAPGSRSVKVLNVR